MTSCLHRNSPQDDTTSFVSTTPDNKVMFRQLFNAELKYQIAERAAEIRVFAVCDSRCLCVSKTTQKVMSRFQ